jgi:hypothetical protein
MGDTVNDFKLLSSCIDPLDEVENEFRILVDGKFVKYLTIDPKLYSDDDMYFGPTLNSIIPLLPPGDWNTGRISRNCADGHPHFSEVKKVELPRVTHLWHPVHIDYLDLHMGQSLRPNVFEATAPQFDLPFVVKFAAFPYETQYLDSETSAYQWLQNHQIGPQFLGHLTEGGRVIGFAIERISNCRHAMPGDLALCQQALSKLHRLNIKHGDINKHNFLIHDDRATLIDFENALQCNDADVLEEEFQRLEKELSDKSGKGGKYVEGTSPE